MLNIFSSSKNVCLCLSGGGALGFAHIGAIQALEENGIFPNRISGTSMGAIVGAFYAAGFSPAELLELVQTEKLYRISKLLTFKHVHQKGFSDHSTLRKLIREKIPHNSFEGLKKEFMLCVSNLNTARWEIIKSGKKLDMWVAASASIPGIFETINHKKNIYTDGGALNNMPAQPFESDFRTTIGVDVVTYSHLEEPPVSTIMDTALTALRAMQHQNSAEGRDICRYLIEPPLIPEFYELSFDNYHEIYKIGYDATIKYISGNRDILSLKQK